MTARSAKFAATLIFPDDFSRHFNQVASVTATDITFLRRRVRIQRSNRTRWELIKLPMSECERVQYRSERSPLFSVLGILLIAAIVSIGFFGATYWDSLDEPARVPAIVILLVTLYGVRWLFDSHRHRLTFVMRDGTKLKFKSRTGDYSVVMPGVQKIIEFSRQEGMLDEKQRRHRQQWQPRQRS